MTNYPIFFKYMLVAALEKMQGKNWLEGINSWQSVFPLSINL